MPLLSLLAAVWIDARVPVDSGRLSVVTEGRAAVDTVDSMTVVENGLPLIDPGMMLRERPLQPFLLRFVSPQERLTVRTTLDDPVRKFRTRINLLLAALSAIRDATPDYSAATGIAGFELSDGGVIEFTRTAGVWYMHHARE